MRLEATRPTFGGLRWWLVCPVCKHHRLALYVPRVICGWGCRACHRLGYRSKLLDPYWRLDRRLDACWQRLGGEADEGGAVGDEWPLKPKGMHWATYERLQDRYEAINDASWRVAAAGIDRFWLRLRGPGSRISHARAILG